MKKKIIIGVAILVLLIVTSGFLSVSLVKAASPVPKKIGTERLVYEGTLDGKHVTIWRIRTSDYRTGTILIADGNNRNISVLELK